MEPKICPYLGLIDDPNTSTAFPYEGNSCYRSKRPVPVSLEHQRTHCLADAHIDCPGYLNGWVNGFPKELRAYQPTHTKILQNKWLWVVLVVALLATVGFLFPREISSIGKNISNGVGGLFAGVGDLFTRPTFTATASYTPTSAFTETSTVTSTSTVTPTETATPTPTATRTYYYVPPQPTRTPTDKPKPKPTNTPVPTSPPRPTSPPAPTATEVPAPSKTPTPVPTNTPIFQP